MPDRYYTIKKDGFIIGGDEIPFKRNQNLFDYVVFKSDLKTLKETMTKASGIFHQDIELNFQYLDRKNRYFCRIYKYDNRYLIGGWRLPKKVLYFPKGTAA